MPPEQLNRLKEGRPNATVIVDVQTVETEGTTTLEDGTVPRRRLRGSRASVARSLLFEPTATRGRQSRTRS